MKNIIIKNLDKITDIQSYLEKLNTKKNLNKRFFIEYQNNLFKESNWLDKNDIKNLLTISGYQFIAIKKDWIIARIKTVGLNKLSVSIVIPARNEARNIPGIIKSIPYFGKSQEIIFVEGGSKDDTWLKIQAEIKTNKIKARKVIALKQPDLGKANAVRLGFRKSTADILIIYDADRTVDPKDIIKFYNILVSGEAEFANGSRLVYPMEKDAMQMLNKIANKIFGLFFTKVFGQIFKDTLCGTKALFKKDYNTFKYFKDDPFGDFELIFGAIQNNLKVIEIPIRYKERIYGMTNIKRFHHGLLLFKIMLIAVWKFSLKKLFLPTELR